MLVTFSILLFALVAMVSFLSLFYWFEASHRRKVLSERLSAIEELDVEEVNGVEGEILKAEFLKKLPSYARILAGLSLVRTLHRYLRQAGLRISLSAFISLALGAAILPPALLLAAGLSGQLCLLVGCISGSLPWIVTSILRHRRLSKFEEQFPDSLEFLARAVRAGHAVTTVLEMIGEELPEPVASEYRQLHRQQNIGLPMSEALENFSRRVPLAEVRVFVAALQIQREAGGNLAEILDNLSTLIRERFRLQRQVKIHTAEGRMSMYILTAAPPITALLLYLSSPGYLDPLIYDPLGHRMIVGGLFLLFVGFLVINRITKIQV